MGSIAEVAETDLNPLIVAARIRSEPGEPEDPPHPPAPRLTAANSSDHLPLSDRGGCATVEPDYGSSEWDMTVQASVLDLASTPVVAVRPELDAMNALFEMYRRDVHHLAVVVDGDAVGLVSAADLLQGIAAQYPKTTTPVGALCPAPGPRVDAADDIGVAAQRMIDAHTDAVLVMRAGRVCGVLTAVDLVRSIAGAAAEPEAEGSR